MGDGRFFHSDGLEKNATQSTGDSLFVRMHKTGEQQKAAAGDVYGTPDEAAKHAFHDNNLLKKSQDDGREFGFFIYKAKDAMGRWGYTYSQPFEANGKLITQQEWQAHDVAPQYRYMVAGSGHTHPDRRPWFNNNSGYETFSPNDLRAADQGYLLYMENAYGQIRLRKPGDNADTLIDGPKDPTQSLKIGWTGPNQSGGPDAGYNPQWNDPSNVEAMHARGRMIDQMGDQRARSYPQLPPGYGPGYGYYEPHDGRRQVWMGENLGSPQGPRVAAVPPPARGPIHQRPMIEIYSEEYDPPQIHWQHAQTPNPPDYAHRIYGGPQN